MNSLRVLRRSAVAMAAAGLAVTALAAAAGGEHTGREGALLERIEALEARIAALEAARSIAGFMPELAERFHVLHEAGEAGDWAVASHELTEMKRLSRLSPSIDREKGVLLQQMLEPSLEALEEAIEEGEPGGFESALARRWPPATPATRRSGAASSRSGSTTGTC